jgi:MoxR-like ATPase
MGGKAMAAMDGRFSVAIDDIKKVAIPVLRHRVSTNFQAQAEGKTSEDIVEQILALVGEPEVAKYERRRGPKPP